MSATRTALVTGAASGIGRATADELRSRGVRVVGADLAGSDLDVDLATDAGRRALVDGVADRTGGVLDVVVACAGTVGRGAVDVRVNHFGAVATLDGLRPLLAAGDRARAVAVASFALIEAVDDDLVDRCLADDEVGAAARATEVHATDPGRVYASAKRALVRWVRRQAPTDGWAGAGIALNAVAPGIVRTPMTEPILATPSFAEVLLETIPMPFGGVADASAVAHTVGFLADERLAAVTGQVVFVDGGADCVRRPDDIWS